VTNEVGPYRIGRASEIGAWHLIRFPDRNEGRDEDRSCWIMPLCAAWRLKQITLGLPTCERCLKKLERYLYPKLHDQPTARGLQRCRGVVHWKTHGPRQCGIWVPGGEAYCCKHNETARLEVQGGVNA